MADPRYRSGCKGNGLAKPAARIEQLCDERREGNGWIVYLRPGWAFQDASTPNATHMFGEDTKAEMWRSLRTTTPCYCADCVSTLAAGGSLWGER